MAKGLNSNKFHQRVIDKKKRHKIDELHEHEAEEDLHEFFGLGKAAKE